MTVLSFWRIKPKLEADLLRFLLLPGREWVERDRLVGRTASSDELRWLWRRRLRRFRICRRRFRIARGSFWKSSQYFVVFFDEFHRFEAVLPSSFLQFGPLHRERVVGAGVFKKKLTERNFFWHYKSIHLIFQMIMKSAKARTTLIVPEQWFYLFLSSETLLSSFSSSVLLLPMLDLSNSLKISSINSRFLSESEGDDWPVFRSPRNRLIRSTSHWIKSASLLEASILISKMVYFTTLQAYLYKAALVYTGPF